MLNVAVLGAVASAVMIHGGRRLLAGHRRALLAVVAVAAWLSVVVGASAAAFELALSGTAPAATLLPAMAGVHAVIGIGEAVITVSAVAAVLASRPDLVAFCGRVGMRRGLVGGAA